MVDGTRHIVLTPKFMLSLSDKSQQASCGGRPAYPFVFRSPELKNVSRETFGSGSEEITDVSQNAPDFSRAFVRASFYRQRGLGEFLFFGVPGEGGGAGEFA
jgi:hypothetical protein